MIFFDFIFFNAKNFMKKRFFDTFAEFFVCFALKNSTSYEITLPFQPSLFRKIR